MGEYRLYCETEGTQVYTASPTPPTECPNDVGHTIRAGSAVMLAPETRVEAGGDMAIPDEAQRVDITAPGITLTLPLSASRKRGDTILIKDVSGQVGQQVSTRVTINVQGGNNLEGAGGARIMNEFGMLELDPDGVDTWYVLRY